MSNLLKPHDALFDAPDLVSFSLKDRDNPTLAVVAPVYISHLPCRSRPKDPSVQVSLNNTAP